MDELLKKKQKQFRASGLVLFCSALALLIARIVATLISGHVNDTLIDVIFSVMVQVLALVIVPFVVYKFALKKSFVGVMRHSNVRTPNVWVMLLSIPLGVCCLFATMGVSTIWQTILIVLGYNHGASTPLPETLSVGMLILELVLTGVLPGLCEEFANRGGIITALRSAFNPVFTVILGGVVFGLFHQNITQVFYTFWFGMLMTALVLKTKSIFPGVIVHFVNNALSVYFDYAGTYNLPLGGVIDWINATLQSNFFVVIAMWLGAIVMGAGIVYAILVITKRAQRKRAQKSDGIVIVAVDGVEVEDKAELPLADKVLYRPVLRDWAFYIGAMAVMAITTLFTFSWGL